jgi:hypothetical protein
MLDGSRALSGVLLVVFFLGLAGGASAAPRSIAADGTVTEVEGSFLDAFTVGDGYSGVFTHDTDESNAGPGSDPTPSAVPGHEYSSFYEFLVPPYGTSLSFPAIPASFEAETVAVVVNDDLALTAEETNGAVSDGTYDWIELLGSNTVSVCLLPGGTCEPDEFSPADGNEWTLAIIADTGWISDGSQIPDTLPVTYTALLVGIEFDVNGNETGVVFGSATVSEGTGPVEVPALGSAAAGALGGLLALGALRQRRRTTPGD